MRSLFFPTLPLLLLCKSQGQQLPWCSQGVNSRWHPLCCPSISSPVCYSLDGVLQCSRQSLLWRRMMAQSSQACTRERKSVSPAPRMKPIMESSYYHKQCQRPWAAFSPSLQISEPWICMCCHKSDPWLVGCCGHGSPGAQQC